MTIDGECLNTSFSNHFLAPRDVLPPIPAFTTSTSQPRSWNVSARDSAYTLIDLRGAVVESPKTTRGPFFARPAMIKERHRMANPAVAKFPFRRDDPTRDKNIPSQARQVFFRLVLQACLAWDPNFRLICPTFFRPLRCCEDQAARLGRYS